MSENFESLIETGMFVTYGLIAIAAATSILFPIVHYIKDIRKAKGVLIGIVVLAAVLLFAYAISSGEPYDNVSATASRWISAGINSVFLLAGLAVVAAVFTEVVKIFK